MVQSSSATRSSAASTVHGRPDHGPGQRILRHIPVLTLDCSSLKLEYVYMDKNSILLIA